jgi:hypothetical protein
MAFIFYVQYMKGFSNFAVIQIGTVYLWATPYGWDPFPPLSALPPALPPPHRSWYIKDLKLKKLYASLYKVGAAACSFELTCITHC